MKNSSPIKKLSLIASGVALSTCVLAVDRANAQTILLDFEGLKDTEQILNFYNGGTGSQGSSGINYGVSFSPNSLAIVQGAPGSNIGGLPTPVTGAFFLSGSASTMNVANGFSTGFSFFYSAPFQPGVVRIYDGLNATGNLLGSINLPLTPNGASVPGCNSSNFCPFVPIGLAFNGIAKSVDFGGAVNQIVFDDIKITLAPTTTVPEPTSVMGLIAISALGAGSVLQRKLLK
ncbi:PEP-CTERM sorting domain-containing protein [Microcystis wesenbergii]|uniref:PEP-CTERM sorting domain-containing protein n=1 Tax=Microcystis wesenbergii NRERC-220 TaxID=3068991 RepID=A0ABU3HNP6_9CHRO|nr:PEP-CTERM sorting domain-containing protein [Microcystis wesenbergii]MDT3676181.1 PEP-CTERM sorting domain-containing protein [Microcystis wesenbergii NRERC-220]